MVHMTHVTIVQTAHLVVGGQHAHVERHGADDGGAGPPEQAGHALLADNPGEGVADALVVAPPLGGQGRVRLHADERQIRRGPDQGPQTSGRQASQSLLPQWQGLQASVSSHTV